MASLPSTPRKLPLWRQSSALLALASLSPPSPVLSPSQFPAALSSGEIPILFDLTNSLISSPEASRFLNLDMATVDSGSLRLSPRLEFSDSEADGLAKSQVDASAAPVASVNVYREYSLPYVNRVSPSGSLVSPSPSICSGSFCNTPGHQRISASSGITSNASESNGSLHLWSGAATGNDNASISSHISLCQKLYQSFSWSTLPSPSGSVEMSGSCPASPLMQCRSSSLHPSSTGNHLQVSPGMQHSTSRSCLSNSSSWHVLSESALSSKAFTPAGRASHPTQVASASARSARHKIFGLPQRLAWLQDITVSFLVDQEGFRSVRPTFRLSGYTDKGSFEGGSAEFMPIKRETFIFHYAAFDSPPTLRRVMVNNDERRDHISRQAALILKENGVYTVHGSETSSLRMGAVKLEWKFEYVVDYRRAEITGRIVPGERRLTPLMFSCSPELLHPLQGKKVKLMHVVKKHVVTKIAAEKLVPPQPPVQLLLPLGPSKQPKAFGHAQTVRVPTSQKNVNMHRRAWSCAPQPQDQRAHLHRGANEFVTQSASSRSPIAMKTVFQAHVSHKENCSLQCSSHKRCSSADERRTKGVAWVLGRRPPQDGRAAMQEVETNTISQLSLGETPCALIEPERTLLEHDYPTVTLKRSPGFCPQLSSAGL